MTATSPFESKPRWPGAPKICVATNLPGFDSLADWSKFEAANCPGTHVVLKWKCSHCDCYHVWTIGSDPAGASSGTGRSTKLMNDDDYVDGIYARFNLRR